MSIYIHRDGNLVPLVGNQYSPLPIGTVIAFAGETIPDEFLLCDGSTFDETKYPDLYNLLGTNTVPDLRGRFLEGATASQKPLTNIAAGLPNITGTVTAWGGGTANSGALQTTSYGNWASANASSGGAVKLNVILNASKSNSIYGASSTVQPPATTVNYIIKATPSMSADVSRFLTKGDLRRDLTWNWNDGKYGIYSGFISGSRTSLQLEIPCNTVNLVRADVESLALTVRGIDGYIRDSYTNPITIDRTTYNTLSQRFGDAYCISPTGILLNIIRVNGGEWGTTANPVTNNTPVSYIIRDGTIKLTYED